MRARQGQLKAEKIGRNWFTTREWVREYLARQVSVNVANLSKKGIVIRTAAALPDIDFHGGLPRERPRLSDGGETSRAQLMPSSFEDPVLHLRNNVELLHRIRSREEEERARTEERADDQFEKFFSRFTDSLDRHTESHLGFLRNGINWFKRESAQILRSKKKSFVAFCMLLSFVVIPATAALGKFDDVVWYAYQKVRDAETLRGHTPGYSANQVLLLDKEGKISIIGHIETEGQLRAFIKDGVAPIVVDSMTKVENLNADYLDNLSSEDFTLAFVTKNGNITHQDVFLEGRVEIGKTLTVKGATKLLSSLEISGEVRALADVFLAQNLSVKGVANLTTVAADFITARVINARAIRGDSVTAIALESTDTFLAKNMTVNGQSVFNGMAIYNEGLTGTYGIFQKGLDVAGSMNVSGKSIKLGTLGDSNIALNSQEWNIQKNGIAAFASTTVNGLLAVTGSGTSTVDAHLKLTNLEILGACIGCGALAQGATGWTDDGTSVRLTAVGDFVGIGTTSPFAKLSLVGVGTTTGFSFAIANSTSTTIFVVQDNGNVGIGTTSPYARLSVVGDVVAASFAATSSATSTFAGGISTNGILNVSGTAASSTFANGISLANGCYAVGGACIISNTANLSGSGTQNFITKWTSPTALGNSSLFDDGLFTGIGTSTPLTTASRSLAIYGSTTIQTFQNVPTAFRILNAATTSVFTVDTVSNRVTFDYGSTTALSAGAGTITNASTTYFSTIQNANIGNDLFITGDASSTYFSTSQNLNVGNDLFVTGDASSTYFSTSQNLNVGNSLDTRGSSTINSALNVGGTILSDGTITSRTGTSSLANLDLSGALEVRGSATATFAGPIRSSLTTGGIQIAGLANCDTINTNTDGYFRCGTDAGTFSGTLNFLSKFTTDGTTIGNSSIFDDGLFVGIGTSTPLTTASRSLAIYGSTTIQTFQNVPTAFRILNAATTSVFTVDTVSNRVTFDYGSTTALSAGAGTITNASTTYFSTIQNANIGNDLIITGDASSTYLSTLQNLNVGNSLDTRSSSTINSALNVGGTILSDGTITSRTGTSSLANLDISGALEVRGSATATFAGPIRSSLTTGGIQIAGLANCDTINTNTDGYFRCGTDAGSFSGTLNFLSKFTTDGTTIGNSSIFDDGLFVGIGTSTPLTTASRSLAIYGSTTIQTWQNVPTAFRILNAATTSVFTVDTVSNRVTFDYGSTTALSATAGTITNASTTYFSTIQNANIGNDLIITGDASSTYLSTLQNLNVGNSLDTRGSSTINTALNVGGTILSDGTITSRTGTSSLANLDLSGALEVRGSATATFAGPIRSSLTTGGIQIAGLANCDTINTNTDGYFRCGTDAGTFSGTLNFLSKFTTDGTTIGNSSIFDDGLFVGIGTSTPLTTASRSLAIYGSTTIQTWQNVPTAFRILNAATTSVFTVDTVSNRVTFDYGSTTALSATSGTITNASTTYFSTIQNANIGNDLFITGDASSTYFSTSQNLNVGNDLFVTGDASSTYFSTSQNLNVGNSLDTRGSSTINSALNVGGTILSDGTITSRTGTSSLANLDISGALEVRGSATATFAGPIRSSLTTGGIQIAGLSNCNTIDTNTDGYFRCGADAGTLSGTLNFISKFTTDGTTLGNSSIFDDGFFTGIGTSTPLTTASRSLAIYGSTTIQTFQNVPTAFRILNAATSSVFTVDTISNRVTFDYGSTTALSATSGTITNASTTYFSTIQNANIGNDLFITGDASSTYFSTSQNLNVGNDLIITGDASSTYLSTSQNLNVGNSLITGASSTFGGVINVSSGTSTFNGGIFTLGNLNVAGSGATSTFANGITLANGCFAINGSCVGGGSGGVTGAGTQNFVAKYTTTGSTIGNSSIFDDGLFVGIGTSTPLTTASRSLAIYGSTTIQTFQNVPTAFRILNAATTSVFTVNTVTGTTTIDGGAGGGASTTNLIVSRGFLSNAPTSTFSGGLVAGANTALTVNGDAAANSLYIATNGNVGIGTASPNELFTIAPPANQRAEMGLVSTSGAGSQIFFGDNGQYNAGIAQNFLTTNDFQIAVSNDVDVTGDTNFTNNIRLTILPSGNTGIGTTTPLTPLSVYGSTTLQTWQNVPTAFQVLNAATSSVFTVDTINGSTSIAGLLNVAGAGTSTINQNLWVQGAIRAGTGSTYLDTNGLVSLSGDLKIQSLTANNLLLNSGGGNVGIGTTSPWGLLSVNPNGITGPAFVVGSSTQCVTGDTRLRRRRRKKRKGNGTTEDDEEYLYDEIAIKDIQPGDEVLSLNEKTGRLEYRRVNALMDMGVKPIYKLTTASGKTIRTTGNHPYFVRVAFEANKKPAFGADFSGTAYDTVGSGLPLASSLAYAQTVSSGGVDNFQAVEGRGVEPLGSWVAIQNRYRTPPTAQLLYHTNDFSPNNGRWTKVLFLKEGYEIATMKDNENVVWDAIVKIEHLSAEQVYDIEVEGTHNFIGNDIVAHNTYLTVTNGGNVGIGTAAPSANLHIRQSEYDGNSIIRLDTSNQTAGGVQNAQFIFTSSGENSLDVRTNYVSSLNKITLSPGASTAMTLLGSGNVGIGTTGPDTPLTVGTVSATGQIASHLTSISGAFEQYTDAGSKDWAVGVLNGSSALTFFEDRNVASAGNERMRIVAGGNVGIGTTAPTQKLDVATGNIALGYNQTATNMLYKTFATGHAVGNVPSQLSMILDDGSSSGIRIKNTRTGSFNSQAIHFDVHEGGVAARADAMVINYTGNVGIGETAPGSKLSVSGGGSFGASYDTTAAPTNGLIIEGKVGIGTVSPSSDLDVENSSVAAIDINSMNSHAVLKLQAAGANKWVIYNESTNYDLFIDSADGTKMLIKQAGNVGIGTTVPEARTQITGGGLCVGSNANCNTDNNTEGTVYSGATSMTLYDVAENYPTKDASLAAEEIVSLDTEQGVFVKRAASSSDVLLGVISEKPAVHLGGFNGAQFQKERQVAIALSGRVPVKISTEGGPIKIGDRIALSSLAGIGAKAATSGQTIGIALENFDGWQETGGTQTRVATGTILVFVNLGYSKLDTPLIEVGLQSGGSPTSISSTSLLWSVDQASGRIKPVAGLDLNGNDIVGVKSLISTNGTWSIGEDGTLRAVRVVTDELIADNIKARLVEAERVKAAEVEADEFRIFRPANAEEASVGEGRILRGETETTIYSSKVASTSKIFVSFTSDLQGRSYFIDKSPLIEVGLQSGTTQAFKLKISSPMPDDATFDWWVVNTAGSNQQPTPITTSSDSVVTGQTTNNSQPITPTSDESEQPGAGSTTSEQPSPAEEPPPLEPVLEPTTDASSEPAPEPALEETVTTTTGESAPETSSELDTVSEPQPVSESPSDSASSSEPN